MKRKKHARQERKNWKVKKSEKEQLNQLKHKKKYTEAQSFCLEKTALIMSA